MKGGAPSKDHDKNLTHEPPGFFIGESLITERIVDRTVDNPYESSDPRVNLGDDFSTKVDACGDGEDRVLYMVAHHGGNIAVWRRRNNMIAVWVPPESERPTDTPMSPMHATILKAHKQLSGLNR